MSHSTMTYLMVLQVRYLPLDSGKIQIESAFWHHLLTMKARLASNNYALQVALLPMSAAESKAKSSGLLTVTPEDHGIQVHAIYNSQLIGNSSKRKKLVHFVPTFLRILKLVKRAHVVHTGMSYDSYLPTSFFAVLSSVLLRKKLIYIIDIDFRESSKMLYDSGEWSFTTYIVNRFTHDLFKRLQLRVGTKKARLSLLKGKKFAQDYASWGRNVLAFVNTVHSTEDVITEADLSTTLEKRRNNPNLSLVYFGRVVKYKGIQQLITALGNLSKGGMTNVRLTVIGDGDFKPALQQLAIKESVEEYVHFLPSVPYGNELFKQIKIHDALIALPQRQDTPRSAFDAMVMGLPILAYDTDYYVELDDSNAIYTTPWLNAPELERTIQTLANDKSKLLAMAPSARQYAAQNTMEGWMDKRIDLTLGALADN